MCGDVTGAEDGQEKALPWPRLYVRPVRMQRPRPGPEVVYGLCQAPPCCTHVCTSGRAAWLDGCEVHEGYLLNLTVRGFYRPFASQPLDSPFPAPGVSFPLPSPSHRRPFSETQQSSGAFASPSQLALPHEMCRAPCSQLARPCSPRRG